MKVNKSKIYTILGIIILVIAFIGATFAFFVVISDDDFTHTMSVTSNTTDNISFQISNDELTITRYSTYSWNNYIASVESSCWTSSVGFVRRVFYLTQNTTTDMINHQGTASDPYRIS